MKTVLITGGSRGIGRAMVELFSKNGYMVAFTYKNSENEAKTVAESTGALAIRADSEDENDVAKAVEVAERELSHIDCLVNNAGVSSFSLFTDVTLAEWNRIMAVNLTGAFLYSRSVIPGMVRRGSGRIINISSMWGLVGSSCEVAYSASKAGVIGFTKALAKEVGPSNIRVNCVAPGAIDTDMNSALDETALKELCDETPLGKIGLASDVAKAVVALCDNEFITGQVLSVNGGLII